MILHDTFAATPLDRKSLPQGNLDIAERVRTNPLPWAGQFSPQLVERLLTATPRGTGSYSTLSSAAGRRWSKRRGWVCRPVGPTSTQRRWPWRRSTGWSTWTRPGGQRCSTSCAKDFSRRSVCPVGDQASIRPRSFFMAFFSIWRIRSADTPYSPASSWRVAFSSASHRRDTMDRLRSSRVSRAS